MDDLFTPVSQTYRKPDQENFLTISQPAKPVSAPRALFKGTSPEEILEALKSQPDYETLLVVLRYLQQGSKRKQPFNILRPSPQSAQIVHILVTEIVPNYWALLTESSSSQKKNRDLDALLDCLLSITGLNAALVFLRVLLQQAKKNSKGLKQSHAVFNLSIILKLLSQILQPVDKAQRIWTGLSSSEANAGKIRALRQEFVSVLAGGKVVSLAAEAESVLQEADTLEDPFWVADSKKYVEWLGRNLVNWMKSECGQDDLKLCADLLTRGLKLGHSDALVKILFTEVILRDNRPPVFAQLLDSLPQIDQRKVLMIVLKLLASQLPYDADKSTEDYPLVWAASGVLVAVIGTSRTRRDHLVTWLTDASGAGIGDSCGIRRAAMTVLAGDKETITTVLEKSLSQFGEQLYIRHSPILQQEAHAQVLLLSAGYVHRISPIKLTILLRSSTYLNAISNRIAASQNRARFLGMVVGEALSGLVHGDEKKLDFHMDETNSEEAKWYKSLVRVSDQIGPISPLRVEGASGKPGKASNSAKPAAKAVPRLPKVAPPSGFIIEEIEGDEEEGEEDDDLVPYAKPDSDAEDSDDDPTLITRNKPKAPVYIRDLIEYLRDVDNYDRQKLALTTAPVLIRRKANYGTEVSSHAVELATLLVGLQDKYDLGDFHNLRLQGMVAIIVARPQEMGQWFAKTFFDGDYSLSQRASVLIVLGLSGRDIAGFDTSEYASASAFPSKQLPAKLEKHYVLPSSSNTYTSSPSTLKALPANSIDKISQTLSQTFLAPLAAEAADAATGPDALKLSSFTSRLQDPSKVRSKKKSNPPGIRNIPNTTATLLSTSFFFPLTSRFQAALHSASASTRGILFQADLLTLYLKTLALLLHAAGPSTLALPQMTAEFWDLLLGVRGQCVGELGITGAVLFGLMTLLDVNEGDVRGLCQRHGREVVESVEWVSGVFDRTRGGDAGGDGEENQVKMMAAGVLIRLREAMEKHRALLMGDMIGFT
ncbi:telomere length regulation protein [Xylariales sp. AK1849]|nr:telomere length regulation protein [Xylariales sp. AK1849]